MASRRRNAGKSPTANCVGRVGALALALGVGGACIAGPGIAWADDSPADNGSDTVSSAGDESPATPGGDTPDGPGRSADGGQEDPASTLDASDESTPPQVATVDDDVQVQQTDENTLKPESVDSSDLTVEEPEAVVAGDRRAETGSSEHGIAHRDPARVSDGPAGVLADAPTARAPIVDELRQATQTLLPTAAPSLAAEQFIDIEVPRPQHDPMITSIVSAALVPAVAHGGDLITFVSTALRVLLSSGEGDLPESPLLWAALAWARRNPTAQTAAASDSARALADTPTTSVFFGTSPRVVEADGTVLVPIVRTGDLTHASTIEYGITSDTATSGVDYVGGSGTITIGAGEDRGYIPVQILDDDLSEPTETFVVSIINVDSGSTILYPRTTRIDILDDENPVVDPPSPPLASNYHVTEQVVVSDLTQPIAFEFAPHDPSLLYIAEKGGVIKVFNTETGQQSTFVDISADVNDIQDRGLMDIALHPDFGTPVAPGEPEHNYVYAFYVVDPAGTEANAAGTNAGMDGGGNRFAYLVRFTADEATGYTTAVPDSQVILLGGKAVPGESELQPRTLQDISGAGAIDSTSDLSQPESGYDAQTGEYEENYIKVDSRSHAGGALAFGPDGALYVSVGDGTSFNTTDPRSVSVQDVDSLSGKILRIDPITGLGLPDNPFVEPGDDLSANSSKVYQLGLRNPFSMAFSDDGRLFITNTGWNTWEEIESGHAGANFGWPYFEGGDTGIARAPGYQNIDSAADFYAAVANGSITITSAYRAFGHSEAVPGFQLGAIVGVDSVYTGTRYPAEFQNDIFFTDINDGEVYVVDINNRNDVKYLYSSESTPVAFREGPDGYVYVANLGDGTITRLLIEPSDTPIINPNNAFEKELEALWRDTGWIPVWGSLVSAVGFVLDLNDLLIALRADNTADKADEIGDLVADGLGMVLGFLPGGVLVADSAADYVASLLCLPRVSTA